MSEETRFEKLSLGCRQNFGGLDDGQNVEIAESACSKTPSTIEK